MIIIIRLIRELSERFVFSLAEEEAWTKYRAASKPVKWVCRIGAPILLFILYVFFGQGERETITPANTAFLNSGFFRIIGIVGVVLFIVVGLLIVARQVIKFKYHYDDYKRNKKFQEDADRRRFRKQWNKDHWYAPWLWL